MLIPILGKRREWTMSGTSLQHRMLTQHQAEAVQIVDRYWHQMAAGRGVPNRFDVDPGAIQDALEYAFIAEHLSAGQARLRVAGGSISAVMGMEVAGMPLAVLVSPPERATFAQHVARVFSEPVKIALTLTAPATYGQPELQASLRLYPLMDMAGHTRHLIGTFVTTGVIGRTPRRFGVSSVVETPVTQTSTLVNAPILTRGHLSLVVSR